MTNIFRTAIFFGLTILTQVGGAIYIVSIFICSYAPLSKKIILPLFVILYSVTSLLLVPPLAKTISNRVPLPCNELMNLKSQSILYCVLNRHYVNPKLLKISFAMSNAVAEHFPGTVTQTLDANFPFIDGFPMLPHLSHDDGKKLDIAFSYQSEGTYRPSKTASPIGYWHFSRAQENEPDPECYPSKLNLRWDMRWFQIFNDDSLVLEPNRTNFAIKYLTDNANEFGVSKVLLEPHLKHRFGLRSDKVRFQGCRAARHDDHFHFQIQLK